MNSSGKRYLTAAVPLLIATIFLQIAEGCAQRRKTNKNQAGNSLVWSSYKGSFQQFVNDAIRSGRPAVIDKPLQVSSTIRVEGDLHLQGTGIAVQHRLEKLFVLGKGTHVFENFSINQLSDQGVAFFTDQTAKLVWNNTLRNIQITGGRDGYASSRGGVYDAKRDTVLQWAGTNIENCIIKVKGGCAISIFSQDGPGKFLHLRNVQMGTDTTHNIYAHPNVSIRMDSVVSLYAGKLALHYFSGGNEWMYGTARYFVMHRVQSLKGANWEMVAPKNNCIQITDSDIAPYTTLGVSPPHVCARNTRFYNGGNGAMLSGTLTNCRGTVWGAGASEKPLQVEGGSFDEISFRPGGFIRINNASIAYLYVADRGSAFEGEITDCTVEQLIDGGKGNGQIRMKNTKLKKASGRKEIIVEN